MREVINYKPDIFTRCFSILALPVGHGCQYIFSCLLTVFLPHLLSSKVAQIHPTDSLTRQNVPMQRKCPKISEFLFGACNYYCYSYFIIFVYLYFILHKSARSVCFVPQSQNDKMRMQMRNGTFKTVT